MFSKTFGMALSFLCLFLLIWEPFLQGKKKGHILTCARGPYKYLLISRKERKYLKGKKGSICQLDTKNVV